MKGRKPLPSALRALGPRSHHGPQNREEPRSDPASGRCPRWVPKGLPRYVWGRIAPELVETRILTRLDEMVLGLTACAIADYLDAREVPDADTIRGIALAMQDPACEPETARRLIEALYARAKNSTAAYRAAVTGLAELGATPSARSRVKAQPAAENDPLDEFLRRSRGAA